LLWFLKWPFSSSSIWNTPIGSDADYVHAKIQVAEEKGMTVDEDIIVMKPNAEMMDVFVNNAGWNREKSRCICRRKVDCFRRQFLPIL
jgi:hypothetical protein